ncbi:MAG TPA: hypothetical protein VNN62_00395 [Methylomirabilota bacterium]|jgi:hypothetical protein|nr:hypothetical protein [Methylomirabilota bacterium]
MKGWCQTRKRWNVLAVAAVVLLAFLPLVFTTKHLHFSHTTETAFAQSNSLSPATLTLANATIDIAFAPGALELSRDHVLKWTMASAQAVASYYGQFPVPHVRLFLTPFKGTGVRSGTTYGGQDPLIKVSLGEFTSAAMLQRDWVLTHEMVHLAFPSVPRAHHWIEEGLATYVEPLARHAAGQLSAEVVWRDLVESLPKGLPRSGDQGLDHTPTWGRTYWGGALFCLLADIEIRQRTANRYGLRDALRAIIAAGGSMQVRWPLVRALEIGDQAIEVPVLMELYARMKAAPADIDLADLWRRLGVKVQEDVVLFRDDAPLASIRRAITPGESSLTRRLLGRNGSDLLGEDRRVSGG